MELWLLNHLNTFGLALLLVGGLVAFALLGAVHVRRRFPRSVNGEQNEMVGVLLGMYGAIYGIFLAFVVVAEWEGLGVAEQVVASESANAASIVRDVAVFPEKDERHVVDAVGLYVHAVVDDQWPKMRRGVPDSAATEHAMGSLFHALQSYEPKTESQKAYYETAAGHVNAMSADRRSRLAIARSGLPTLLKILVYGGAIVMIPLTLLLGIRDRRAQLMFVGCSTALIGLALLLAVTLDQPFAGELSVSPDPYRTGVLAQFWK